MKILVYESLPDDAKEIRKAVFINEQGFYDEFDGIDNEATHIVMYNENEVPVATCRVFWDSNMKSYVLGRLAVIKEYRGKKVGSVILQEAEIYVRKKGEKTLILHAQCRVADFYKKAGFIEFGDVENDQGCPHIWMKKIF